MGRFAPDSSRKTIPSTSKRRRGGEPKYRARMSEPSAVRLGFERTVACSRTIDPSPSAHARSTAMGSSTGGVRRIRSASRMRSPAPSAHDAIASAATAVAMPTLRRGRPDSTAAVAARTVHAPAATSRATRSGPMPEMTAGLAQPAASAPAAPSHSPPATTHVATGSCGMGLHARTNARQRSARSVFSPLDSICVLAPCEATAPAPRTAT
ncbi:MAG: hypothetical protein RL325_789 [Planctomycetota bacterium]